MKIEAGKFYRNRDGKKRGPMKPYRDTIYPDYVWSDSDGLTYQIDGRHTLSWPSNDLVSECEPTGPVITETVKRIKPGYYGTVDVGLHTSPARVYINVHGAHDAAELRAAAATLTEIAEALEASK